MKSFATIATFVVVTNAIRCPDNACAVPAQTQDCKNATANATVPAKAKKVKTKSIKKVVEKELKKLEKDSDEKEETEDMAKRAASAIKQIRKDAKEREEKAEKKEILDHEKKKIA